MFYVKAEALRAALKEIEIAEKNGFHFCNAVMEPASMSGVWIELRFSDLWEKAHPTDGRLDWGRCQNITGRFKFKNGKLIALKK